MSDIRFNQWLHQSGTGGVSQSVGGHVGIGTTNPLLPVGAGNTNILHVGVVTSNSISAGSSITATTFYGSGANLTSLPAANLTGTLPAISGANLTSLPAQATIANNADNRVITGGSGVNLNGESTLTYNGSTLIFADTTGDAYIQYGAHSTTANNFVLGAQGDGTFRLFNGTYASGTERLRIGSDGKIDVIGGYIARNPSDSFTLNGVNTPHYGFQLNASSTVPIAMSGYYGISFATTGVERLRIAKTTGDVTVNTGNLVIGTSGKGIDFSATGDASGGSAANQNELLDDYESGTFSPLLKRLSGSTESGYYNQSTREGFYTKVGTRVTITGRCHWSGGSTGSGALILTNIPFTPKSSGTAIGANEVPLVVGYRSGLNYPRITGFLQYQNSRFRVQYIDASGSYGSFDLSPSATNSSGHFYFSATYEAT